MTAEAINWRCDWGVRKYAEDDVARLEQLLGRPAYGDDFLTCGIPAYEQNIVHGNLLTTAGLDRMTKLLIASGATQAMTNTATRVGVGNSTTAATVAQTDLQAAAGSTNRWFQIADASYPAQANGVITVQATFGTADGNFAWNEFGIDLGTPTVTSTAVVNAVLVNRKAAIAQGTKASGQTWIATATITIA